jgi:hypothetical protein
MPRASDKIPIVIMVSRVRLARLRAIARTEGDEIAMVAADCFELGLDQLEGPAPALAARLEPDEAAQVFGYELPMGSVS